MIENHFTEKQLGFDVGVCGVETLAMAFSKIGCCGVGQVTMQNDNTHCQMRSPCG